MAGQALSPRPLTGSKEGGPQATRPFPASIQQITLKEQTFIEHLPHVKAHGAQGTEDE